MAMIRLYGLRFRGFHGVFPEERRLGQEFVVDLCLTYDSRQAVETDELGYAVDYSQAARITKELVEGAPFHLIETLAHRIAARLLEDLPRLEEARVIVHKPGAPLPSTFEDLSVEVHLCRPSA